MEAGKHRQDHYPEKEDTDTGSIMSRPYYERDSDRINEGRIIEFLSRRGNRVHALKRAYPCDLFIKNDNGDTYIAEYKRRHCNHDKYSTFIISAHKIAQCLLLASALKCNFYIIVEYDDGIFVAPPEGYHVSIGGRYDRDDTQDVEPVIEIPRDKFKKLV